MLGKHDIMDRRLCDRNGLAIGKVTAYYRYPNDFDAPWGIAEVTRRRMIIGKTTNLVDLHDAVLQDGAVVAAYTIDTITNAPDHRPIIGNVLTDTDAAEVREHYGTQESEQ